LPQNLLVSWKLVLFFITGFLGLPLGANLLINGATGFAESVGISDEIIGLTIVAVGTSLPELSASISAAYRREVNLLIGNVIGSNMFNILGIGGLVAMISPLNSSQDLGATSFFAMCMSVLILAPFIIWRKAINRLVGIGFLLLYVTYILTII
jgi:cation:H+ antiporter